jgi:hypothetical protein
LPFRLSIEDGPYVQTLEVRSGALTVGRRPPTGLALTSPGLSARHALFRQAGDRVEVEALPTKIGVRLNGERIEREMLRVGDTVHLGWAKITIAEIVAEAVNHAVAETPPATVAASATSPRLEFADEPPPAPAVVETSRVPAPTATATAAAAPAASPAAKSATATVEAPAEFVVLSRQAVRVLPWWGISIALHALLFGLVLLLPKPEPGPPPEEATFAVTLRQTPPVVEVENVPPIELSRRAVDVQRPDMAVAPETPDTTLPTSPDPRGANGLAAPRTRDEIVLDGGDAGSPWAQPGGSTSIGVGVGGRLGTGVASNLDEVFGKDGAGRANAAAAGRLTGDPFTRAMVDGLRLRTSAANVKVVPGDYDKGELVMDALGVKYGLMTGEEVGRLGVASDVRAVFWNCGGRPAPRAALTCVAEWVEAGGWLFSSDWSIDNVVEKAFPGYVSVLRAGTRPSMTPDETITFTIAPGKHPLLAGLPPEAETSRWWLEDSSILFTIDKPEAVEVLAQSADLDRKHGSKLVAVTFRHGKGRVVHVLGHMYQKEGNLRGAYAMQRLLINFLYQSIKGK